MFSCVELILKKRAERKVVPVPSSSLTELPEEYFQEIVDRSIEQFNSGGVQKGKAWATLRSLMKRAKGIFKCFRKTHQPNDSADVNKSWEDVELDLRIMKLYPNMVLPDYLEDDEEQNKRSRYLFGRCFAFFRKSRCHGMNSDSLSEGPEWPSNPTLDEIDRLIAGESLLNPSLEELDRRMKKLYPNWNVDVETTEKDSLNCLSCFRKSESFYESPEWPSNPTLDEIDRLIAGESLLNPSLEELDRRMKKLYPDWNADVEDEETAEKDSLNCLSCFRKSESFYESPEWPSNLTLDEIDRLLAGQSLLNPSLEELDRRKTKLYPNWNVDLETTEKDSLKCLSCVRKSESFYENPEWPSNPTLEEIDRLIAGEFLLNPSLEELDRRVKKLYPNWNADVEDEETVSSAPQLFQEIRIIL